MKNAILRVFLTFSAMLLMSSLSFGKSVDLYHPTDITINNFSCSNIVVRVPALNYYMVMLHHSTAHVYSHDFRPKRVILTTTHGALVFAGDVDNHHVFNLVDGYDFKGGKAAKVL